MPDLTLPTDPAGLLMWAGPWLIFIGTLCVPVTEAVINFWQDRTRADVSPEDQRLVSIYLVPPAVTVALYLFGLALGWVGFSGQWIALVVLLAIAAVGGKQGAYALKAKRDEAAKQVP